MKCPEQHRTACHFNDFVAKRSRELWMNVNFSPVITSFPQHRKNLYKKKEHSGEKQHLETKNESFNRLKVNFYYFIAKSCPWWCPMSCPWCLSSSLRLKGKLFVMDFWFLLDRETNSRPPFIPIDSPHRTRQSWSIVTCREGSNITWELSDFCLPTIYKAHLFFFFICWSLWSSLFFKAFTDDILCLLLLLNHLKIRKTGDKSVKYFQTITT